MNTTAIRTTLVVCFLAGGAAVAQEMPKPPAELDATFKHFEGNWKCETTMPAGSMGPGSPEMKGQATVKIKKDAGGWWYRGTYEIKKSKTMPGMKAEFMLGHTGTQAVMVSHDSMGGAGLAMGAAQGDTITMTGEGVMMGQKVKSRETMTKKGPKEAYHKWEVDMGKGFQVMAEDTCKK